MLENKQEYIELVEISDEKDPTTVLLRKLKAQDEIIKQLNKENTELQQKIEHILSLAYNNYIQVNQVANGNVYRKFFTNLEHNVK
jgi:hypothetical protein